MTLSVMLPSLLLALTVTSLAGASDLVVYDISTQAKCTEVTRGPTYACVWPAGLNPFADQIAEGGRIIAYKLRWSNGIWSEWYVPGLNDLANKFNIKGRPCPELPYNDNSMRRMWASFYSHTHRFIICKPE